MLKFDYGSFVRTSKHGGICRDPEWTQSEKDYVRSLTTELDKLLAVLLEECAIEHRIEQRKYGTYYGEGRDEIFIKRQHIWLSRVERLADIFKRMKKDIGTGGDTITMRKNDNYEEKDEIFAASEDDFWGHPRRVISVNAKQGSKYYFFDPKHRGEARATLFHELTHLYGTLDKEVRFLENAHELEALARQEPRALIRRFFAKRRVFALLGDSERFVLKQPTRQKLVMIFGEHDVWDPAEFMKSFVKRGELWMRKKDGKLGSLSHVEDKNGMPLFYFNFR